jgi:hypothetical protein
MLRPPLCGFGQLGFSSCVSFPEAAQCKRAFFRKNTPSFLRNHEHRAFPAYPTKVGGRGVTASRPSCGTETRRVPVTCPHTARGPKSMILVQSLWADSTESWRKASGSGGSCVIGGTLAWKIAPLPLSNSFSVSIPVPSEPAVRRVLTRNNL